MKFGIDQCLFHSYSLWTITEILEVMIGGCVLQFKARGTGSVGEYFRLYLLLGFENYDSCSGRIRSLDG